MISTKDMTVIGAICQYKNLSTEEQDTFLNNLEDQRYRPVCSVILGRQSKESLSEQELQVLEEIEEWKKNRIKRIHSEQQAARYKQQADPNLPPTRMARNLLKMRERGLVNDEMLLMYGISGDLPERHIYTAMTPEQRREFFHSRMESRFGPNWRRFVTLEWSEQIFEDREILEDWLTEGF